MIEKKYNRHIYGILLAFAIILGASILKVTESFTLPVLISVLLAFVFYPIVKKLNKKFKIPWILAVIIVISLIGVSFVALFSIFYASAVTIMDQYANYEERFLNLYKICAEYFNIPFYEDKNFFENIWSQLKVREFVQNIAIEGSNGLISFSKNLITIFLFMIFLLIEMKNGHEKIHSMFKGHLRLSVHRIISKTTTEVVHYISIKFFISLATAVLVFILLICLNVDFAVMWAFFAFVMNFIPTFGSILSVCLTSLFALLQFYPSPVPVIIVFVGMTAINQILGNFIEPRIEGKNLDLSPFVILVSLTFWGWMWGFIGMILAVPVMVIIKIVCENFKVLHPFAILIGNRTSETLKELNNDDDDEDDSEKENPLDSDPDILEADKREKKSKNTEKNQK